MEFKTPEFLQHCSTDDFLEKMKAMLPKDIDTSEGSHVYNFLIATALVAAETAEFTLPEVIKLVFPEWSYGEFLDSHAKARRITRREAAYASGEVTVTGNAGTVIPAGSIFSTAAVNDEPSVDYTTLEEATIPVSKSVKIAVRCRQAGTIGNTVENTVQIVSVRNSGISAVTNEEAIKGGTEEENDESLIERILEYDRSQGDNYVGSAADYRRWATSVPGVGEATVLSAQDDSGMVTIIITDANGEPATTQLCTDVYNYIMRPDDPGSRLAPVNAYLTVSPPATLSIGIKATVELTDGSTIESVKSDLLTGLSAYLQTAMAEQEVKYTRVASVLSHTAGVNDFSGLQIGVKKDGSVTYGTENIPITATQLPEVAASDLVLTGGTV